MPIAWGKIMAERIDSATHSPDLERRRVYVVDDHSDMRKSIHYLLDTMEITSWPFRSAGDFLHQLPSLAPAPILLDICMPEMDGFELLDELAKNGIVWPVIIMSAYGDIPNAVRAIKLGAIEFLQKPFTDIALEEALVSALGKMPEITRASQARADAKALIGRLTPRESEVIFALTRGLSNKVVAHQLSLSTRTIEMHRANALGKLGVRSLAEIVVIAATSA